MAEPSDQETFPDRFMRVVTYWIEGVSQGVAIAGLPILFVVIVLALVMRMVSLPMKYIGWVN